MYIYNNSIMHTSK